MCDWLVSSDPWSQCESPVQTVKHSPGCLWYSNVCVCLCVGRGSSNKSDGFVGSTVAALFERRPSSVPSASRDRNSSSSLLSTQLVFARNLFSRAVWMCAGLCMLNKEWCIFFFILGRRAANDTTRTHTHTHSNDLTCTYTQMSQGGDLFEDQTSTGGFEKCMSN